MKHVLLSALIVMTGASMLHAQTPQNKKRVVVFDFSDTWCPPCGQYGVAIADTVDHKLNEGEKGYLIGIKGSFQPSSPSSINAMSAGTLFDNFDLSGVPTFMVGNFEANAPTGNNASDIVGIMAAVTSFNAEAVVASTAANMSISGDLMTVTAKTKFWAAATGEYYMTAFLAEDKIVAAQANNSPTTVHPHVLKGTMATTGTALVASPWGEQIGTSSIAANTEFSKTYKVTVDPAWVKANLEVYILIFKKNGNTYEYVNAEKARTATSSIEDAIIGMEQVALYPNPTGSTSSLDLTLTKAMTVDINVTDALGRSVYQAGHTLRSGKNTLTIPSDKFASGLYDVTITGEDKGRMSRKLSVRK